MTPIAHAGHWLVNLAFASPFIIMLAWLGWNHIQVRRGRRPPEEIPEEPPLDDILDGRA